MRPIPETVEAVDELDAQLDDGHLLAQLVALGEQVREVVPDCVGLSVAYLSQGITLTLVASSVEIAALDALQYLDGGPCVDAVAMEAVLEVPDVLDEPGWAMFSEATAAANIRSTLTLPILVEGRVTGSINLYAASVGAFTDHHDQLADMFGAWGPGAVTNADLSFATRSAAQKAPGVLRDQQVIDTVVGYLMASSRLDADAAHRELFNAAVRAGLSVSQLAHVMLELTGDQDGVHTRELGE